MTGPTPPLLDRSRGRRFLLAGLGLPLLGIAAFIVQMTLQKLIVPWYLPVLSLLGVVLIVVSLGKTRTLPRFLALAAVVLLGGLETLFLGAMTLPRYTGPLAVGSPFPAFVIKKADGALFSQTDLTGPQDTALVFFRGRW